jgi:hypothetical protein
MFEGDGEFMIFNANSNTRLCLWMKHSICLVVT